MAFSLVKVCDLLLSSSFLSYKYKEYKLGDDREMTDGLREKKTCEQQLLCFHLGKQMRGAHTTACEGQVRVLKKDLQCSNKLLCY